MIKLGLDIGSNSIGWALISEKSDSIIGSGVVLFQEGNDRDKLGKEFSRNAKRRECRQIRRQLFRRRLRIRKLMTIMSENGLCPNADNLIAWFGMNPYYLRNKALEEKIELQELGRILFHFAKRRGFRSSRKGAVKDTKIDTTDIKSGRIGTKETQDVLTQSDMTLGQYLYSILRKDSEPYQYKERIRNRVFKTVLVEDEFEKIWEYQKQFYPEHLTNELKFILGDKKKGILFFRRELKSQKHLIGKCRYEPQKAKCSKSRVEFEEFRTLQLLNNLVFDENRKLEPEALMTALDFINSKSRYIKLGDLLKNLNIEFSRVNFDLETKIPANTTTNLMLKLLDDDYFEDVDEYKTNEIMEKLWHSLYSSTDSEKMTQYLIANFGGLSEKSIKLLINTNLNDDYAELSLKAIKNILPFLRLGLTYNISAVLGGVKNAFGNRWDNLDNTTRENLIEYVKTLTKSKHEQGELISNLKTYLNENFDLDEKQLKKLYHHSADTEEIVIIEKLQLPENLRNPIVNKALIELRKLVNYILEEYGRPDMIRVELARQLKMPKSKRDELQYKNKLNEAQNIKAIEYLESKGININRANIQKYRLYKEIEDKEGIAYCVYSGKVISISDLFADDNRIEIDHIIPYSISLDDSMKNKVICYRDANHGKSNKTPYQWIGNSDKWDTYKERVLRMFWKSELKGKLNKLVSTKEPDLDGFISRQLNDTHYIARVAKDYLRKICPKVQITQGSVTAILRRYWGLNTILDPSKDEKNRKDNRHHAIDAITVACSKNSHLQKLSTDFAKYSRREVKVKEPWEGFQNDVKENIERMLVKHSYRERVLEDVLKTVRKNGLKIKSKGTAARGELHAETFYGKRKAPHVLDYHFHIRKSLNDIDKLAKFEKIVDPAIKELIRLRLKEVGFDFTKKGKVPQNTFFDFDKDSNLVTPRIYLKNKRGEDVPVFKVRIMEKMSNPIALYSDINKWVDPSNNHHVALYKTPEGKIIEKVVTFWEAVERKRLKLPIVETELATGEKLILSFKKNDMMLLGLRDDEIDFEFGDKKLFAKHLYRVQKFSSWYYVFRKHNASTIEFDDEMVRIVSEKGLLELNPVKVQIDIGGNIKRAKY